MKENSFEKKEESNNYDEILRDFFDYKNSYNSEVLFETDDFIKLQGKISQIDQKIQILGLQTELYKDKSIGFSVADSKKFLSAVEKITSQEVLQILAQGLDEQARRKYDHDVSDSRLEDFYLTVKDFIKILEQKGDAPLIASTFLRITADAMESGYLKELGQAGEINQWQPLFNMVRKNLYKEYIEDHKEYSKNLNKYREENIPEEEIEKRREDFNNKLSQKSDLIESMEEKDPQKFLEGIINASEKGIAILAEITKNPNGYELYQYCQNMIQYDLEKAIKLSKEKGFLEYTTRLEVELSKLKSIEIKKD